MHPSTSMNVGTAITVDSVNNAFVTGYSAGTNSGNDIVTIKYDNNGNQIWLQRYNGPGNGDDEGNAIAVDASGNVYVAGYETTAAGGTEMVLIKYAPGPFLKKEADGSFLLQAVGAAGENFDFQASTNLVDWQDLGTNTADSNGLVQFLDTNASLFPYRFYLTTPQQ
ncbi:MAG: SBBP repeat-containing protein [Verrucomicrobiota bacterium]